MRNWLRIADEKIERFLDDLPSQLIVVPGIVRVAGVVADDPDDDVMAAAIEAGARYVISDDKHLLRLGSWHGIIVMSRDEFFVEMDSLGVPPLP